MKAVDDGTDFDKEKAIASIRKTEVHGEKDRQITCWPSVDELKAKNDQTLKSLRITKVEWFSKDDWNAIRNLRFTLSDGQISKQFGAQVQMENSFEFPEGRPVRSIRMREDGRIRRL